MPPKKSFLWRYFDKCKNGPGFSQCQLCSKQLKTSGNTTNLRCHLQSTHPRVFNELYQTESSSKQTKKLNSAHEEQTAQTVSQGDVKQIFAGPSTSRQINSTHSTDTDTNIILDVSDDCMSSSWSSVNTTTLSREQQPRIEQSFKNIFSWSEGGTNFNKLSNAILYMICKDSQPISVVEDEGFRHLMRTAAPQYKIPSRKAIATLLDRKYNSAASAFKTKLMNVTNFCITTDIWTDLQTRSYLGITVHFGQGSQMYSGTVGVVDLDDRHTADYIAKKLLDVCEEWNISSEKITAVVTDGAANMTKSIDLAFGKKRHLHCIAHHLDLIAKKSIKSVKSLQDIVEHVKNIVTWFKQSVTAADVLRKMQREEKKLIQMVSTRWNSTYHMVNRFLELREEVNTIIYRYRNAPIMVTAREIEELKVVKLLLQPIESATIQISGQSYSTSSIIIPLIFNLEQSISSLVTSTATNTTEIADSLKKSLLNEIKNRFGSAEQVHLLAISTLLDPRFKKMYFKNPLNYSKAVEITTDLLLKMNDGHTIATAPHKNEDFSTEASMETQLWAGHQEMVRQNMAHFTAQEDSQSEITSYLRSPFLPLNQNPLEWWETNKHIYPRLYEIAIKHLTVVATSVPSESLFSKAALTVTKQRSRIKPKRLSKILFLQSLDKNVWEL